MTRPTCGCRTSEPGPAPYIGFCPLHAAAPDLLAAMEDVRQHAAPLVQSGDPLGIDINRIAQAAIAQAKGE